MHGHKKREEANLYSWYLVFQEGARARLVSVVVGTLYVHDVNVKRDALGHL
jgi:hypothetical protein